MLRYKRAGNQGKFKGEKMKDAKHSYIGRKNGQDLLLQILQKQYMCFSNTN